MTAKELLDLLKIYEENGVDLSTFKIINEYGERYLFWQKCLLRNVLVWRRGRVVIELEKFLLKLYNINIVKKEI